MRLPVKSTGDPSFVIMSDGLRMEAMEAMVGSCLGKLDDDDVMNDLGKLFFSSIFIDFFN